MNIGSVVGRRRSRGVLLVRRQLDFCDRPHLDEGWRFNIKLEEAFDCDTVSYDAKCFFVIKLDFYYVNV